MGVCSIVCVGGASVTGTVLALGGTADWILDVFLEFSEMGASMCEETMLGVNRSLSPKGSSTNGESGEDEEEEEEEEEGLNILPESLRFSTFSTSAAEVFCWDSVDDVGVFGFGS